MSGSDALFAGYRRPWLQFRQSSEFRWYTVSSRLMIRCMRTILTLTLLAGSAAAQNSDLALLAGISGPRGSVIVANGTVTESGSVGASLQLNYAWQVVERRTYLYVELPLVIPIRVGGTVTSSRAGTVEEGEAGPDVFFTPGLRLKISPQSRVSFYGAAGVGIASFGAGTIMASPPLTSVSGSRENSFAVDFGGGLDLRLTRLLSLRGDVRDFVTKAGLGDVSGRNHEIFQVGIAFHF